MSDNEYNYDEGGDDGGYDGGVGGDYGGYEDDNGGYEDGGDYDQGNGGYDNYDDYQEEPQEEPEEEPQDEPEEEPYEEPEEEPQDEPEEEPQDEPEEEPQDEPAQFEEGEDHGDEEGQGDENQDDEEAHEDGEDHEHNDDELADEEEEEEDDGTTEAVCGFSNNAEDGDGGSAGMGSVIKGALDGFGGGGIHGIMDTIGKLAGESGGLTNMMSSGGLESMVEKMIGECAHRFIGVNPDTGRIIGSIAGNVIFKMGGQHNSLGSIGKVILDNLISGKFRRDVHPFVPPTAGNQRTFGLDFYAERDRCLRSQQLFEDPEFPAADSSIYYKERPEDDIEWLRPSEIVHDPQLIMGAQSRFDVKQGALGDCWLLAAVANLTLRDELFYRVVPPDQSFTENYAGIFHFQFWRYGKWTDVVIDDRLPCVDGKLYYMHSHEHSTFWSALLEKAYAKLYGSYENLEGGTTAEALEDFTGGLTEFFDLRKSKKSTIMAMLVRGFQMGSLFGCSIDADPAQKEAPLENGLVRGHAYSITAMHTAQISSGDVVLLRIRNPWGNSKEWNGAWSDGSSEWNQISDQQREQMNVAFDKDGEFWMSFDDFFTNFQELEICNLSAQIMNEVSEMTGVPVEGMCKWDEKAHDGAWSTQHGTAGGCTNHPDTYALNPQFGSYFTVTQESVEQDGKCTVIVAVLQKYRREMRTLGLDSLPIGFSVYAIDDQHGPISEDFFTNNKPVARTKVFIDMREVTSRFRVPPGQYVIVPCTFEPNSDGEFLLRIYANGSMQTTRFR